MGAGATIRVSGWLSRQAPGLNALYVSCAGCIDFWWYHGLIADEMHDGLKAACNMSAVGPLVKTGKYGVPHSSLCQNLLNEVSRRCSAGCY